MRRTDEDLYLSGDEFNTPFFPAITNAHEKEIMIMAMEKWGLTQYSVPWKFRTIIIYS